MRRVSLDDENIFEALSYTWGDASQHSALYCNGKILSITANLEKALRYLRYQTEPRTLWVDAVCINQADIEELNQQVALMRDVYTNASRVVA